MKITPVQHKIDQQRIKDHQAKIQREHQEYIKRENQKRIQHSTKGKRIDVYT